MNVQSDFLARMARASRSRVVAARAQIGEVALRVAAAAQFPPPALRMNRFDVIAELKHRSPAAGVLTHDAFDRTVQLKAYADGGACAVSVLTEPDEFLGSLSQMTAAARALSEHGIPVMRKDFLTEPYQIFEARAGGAGGVLIIVTMLDDATVAELVQCALELKMFVLLEGFDEQDLVRIAELKLPPADAPVLAGVNCRDLRTLQVEFDRFEQLAPALPAELPTVAESGIATAEQLSRVAALGYRLGLVGSALMTASDPAGTLADMVASGREARTTCS